MSDTLIQVVPETSSADRMHDLSRDCWCEPTEKEGELHHNRNAPGVGYTAHPEATLSVPTNAQYAYSTADSVMAAVTPGDRTTWPSELRWLWTEHRDQLLALMDRVLAEGFLEPIVLGFDGRLWDGHHRLAVAKALGILVPVTHALAPAE